MRVHENRDCGDHLDVQALCNLCASLHQPFDGEGLSVRLDATVGAARQLVASRPQDWTQIASWLNELTIALDDWRDEFDEARTGLGNRAK
eukprot:4844084-Pyramimonas_sp.AAC.1